MKLAKNIKVIVCDDIRNENGNKFSLMGVYTKSIILSSFPTILPKFCLCIMLEHVKINFQECRVTVKCPETEPIDLFVKSDNNADQIGKDINIFAFIVPLRILKPGPVKLEISFDKNPIFKHQFEIQKATK